MKNLHLYGSPEQVKRWKEEYDYTGQNQSRIDPDDPGHLIVYALPPKSKKEKKRVDDPAPRPERKRRGNGYSRHKSMNDWA